MKHGFAITAAFAAILACAAPARADDPLASYERAAELNPDSSQAQFNLGIMSLKAGDDDRAARALARATRLDPKDAEGWQAYGTALLGLHRLPQSLHALRRSTELDPRRAGAWMELAQALSDDGSKDSLTQAVDACANAAKLKPNDPRPLLNGGLFLAKLGQDARAVALLRRVARRGGGAAAYKALCVLYNKDGDAAAAEDACRRAADDGGGAESWYNLGYALERRGHDPQARSAYRHAVDLDPKHAAALYALAFLDFQAGDADKALRGFKAALDARDGDYPEAEYNVAVLLGDAGRYEDAADLYRRLLRSRPDDADAKANLDAVIQAGIGGLLAQGQSAYERGDAASARGFWTRARRLDPSNGEAARMLHLLARRDASARARAAKAARVAARAQVARRLRAQDEAVRRKGLRAFDLGRWKEAGRLLAFYLGQHPGDSGLRRKLTEARGRERAGLDDLLRRAKAALDAGQRSEAASLAGEALRRDPGDARALSLRAEAGRLPPPASAAQADPEQVRVLYYHGVEQYLAGNLAGAVDTWERVLSLQPDHLDAQRSLARAQLELKALQRLSKG